jgi:hypothetical protein
MCLRRRRRPRGFGNCPEWPTQKRCHRRRRSSQRRRIARRSEPVVVEDLVTVLALLDERRGNVITQRTRLINQLHALLRDLVPGGAPVNLAVPAASRLLATVRAAGPVEAARKQLARGLLAEIRDADQRLKMLTSTIAATVTEHGSQLPTVAGIGAGHRRSTVGTYPSGQPIHYRIGVCQLRRCCPCRGRQR